MFHYILLIKALGKFILKMAIILLISFSVNISNNIKFEINGLSIRIELLYIFSLYLKILFYYDQKVNLIRNHWLFEAQDSNSNGNRTKNNIRKNN